MIQRFHDWFWESLDDPFFIPLLVLVYAVFVLMVVGVFKALGVIS